MSRGLDSYRPQHDEECANRRCKDCKETDMYCRCPSYWYPGNCSCGLAALLAPSPAPPPTPDDPVCHCGSFHHGGDSKACGKAWKRENYICICPCHTVSAFAPVSPAPQEDDKDFSTEPRPDWMTMRLQALAALYRNDSIIDKLGSFRQSEALAYAVVLERAVELLGYHGTQSLSEASGTAQSAAPSSPTPDGTPRPLFDLATLEAIHNYYEFHATTEREMDRWLHEQILRAQKGRDLTEDERKVHLDF